VKIAPAIGSGVGAAILFYAGLCAANPFITVNDPWLAYFRAAGADAHLRATSASVNRRFAIKDWRGSIDEGTGAPVVSLTVGGVPVQIIEFPTVETAQKLAARKHSKAWEFVRHGRWLMVRSPTFGVEPSRENIKMVRELFIKRAETLP